MDTVFLRRYILWGGLCLILFLVFTNNDKLNNSRYNEDVKEQYYKIKVLNLKKVREYYIKGIDDKGHLINIVISPKWDLHMIEIGDSLIKEKNSYKIKVIKKHRTIILIPELPL